MKYIMTVQKIVPGTMIVEADSLDEAFEIAEACNDAFEFDEDWSSIDMDMMNAKEMR